MSIIQATMRVHALVQEVVGSYFEAVDDEAPGLVEGLYLTGSTALGEFRPHTSDIDFLAVTSQHPDAATITKLARAHDRLRKRWPRPFFDGRYVTWQDLAKDPRQIGPGPYSYEGRLYASGRGDCDPITWYTIKNRGIRFRGPEPNELTIWSDLESLSSWTLDNFESYWRPLLRRARRFPDPWTLTAFTSYGAVWIVLGVCRLHHTLATGAIVSKEQAGRYGLRTFSEQWHRVLNEALRIRRADRARPDLSSALSEMIYDLRRRGQADAGSLYPNVVSRRNDVLRFAEMIIADAERRFSYPGREREEQ